MRPGFAQEYDEKKQAEQIQKETQQKVKKNNQVKVNTNIKKETNTVEDANIGTEKAKNTKKGIIIAGAVAVIGIGVISGTLIKNHISNDKNTVPIIDVNMTNSDSLSGKYTDEEKVYKAEAEGYYSNSKFNCSKDTFIKEYIQYRNEGYSEADSYASLDNEYAIINLDEEQSEEEQTEQDNNEPKTGLDSVTIPNPIEFVELSETIHGFNGKGVTTPEQKAATEQKEEIPATKTVEDQNGNEVTLVYDPVSEAYVYEVETAEDAETTE